MLRIDLGNMPPMSTANLRAFCNQKLELNDESYCLRIPMVYVPAYMGNVCNQASVGEEENAILAEPERNASIVEYIEEVESMPLKVRSSGLWDIEVQI